MCFSAPVSFTASAVLATLGTVLIVRTKSKKLLPLAVIPCFFALQQAAEGFVWLSLPHPSFAKNIFLFFAYFCWPLWTPFAFWYAEPEEARKRWMLVCWGLGGVAALLFGFYIPWSSAVPYHCSIAYTDPPNLGLGLSLLRSIAYLSSTVLLFFISSLKKMRFFGCLTVILVVLIYGIDRYFFYSVWCFFQAFLSLGLLWVLPMSDHRSNG